MCCLKVSPYDQSRRKNHISICKQSQTNGSKIDLLCVSVLWCFFCILISLGFSHKSSASFEKKSMIFYHKYFYTINFVWPTALCDRIECYVLTKMKTQNHKKTTTRAHQTRTCDHSHRSLMLSRCATSPRWIRGKFCI